MSNNIPTVNNMTVVSRGKRRGRDGGSIKTAMVVWNNQTFHLYFDHRMEVWTASMKRSSNPGAVFTFAP